LFIEVKFSTRFDSPACLDIYDSVIRIDNDRTLFLSAMCRNDKKILKYELVLDLHDNVQPFEMDPELYETWKVQIKRWEDYLEANKTYTDAWETYEAELKKYKVEQAEKDANKADPYGDETNLFEPTKPTLEQPFKPAQPPNNNTSNYEMQSVGRVYFNLTKSTASRWKKILPDQISKKPQNLGVWWELYEKYEKDLVAFDPWEDDDEDLKKAAESDKKGDKPSKKSKTSDDEPSSADKPEKPTKSNVSVSLISFCVLRCANRFFNLEKGKSKGASATKTEPKEDL